jgi:hypothetical protein
MAIVSFFWWGILKYSPLFLANQEGLSRIPKTTGGQGMFCVTLTAASLMIDHS